MDNIVELFYRSVYETIIANMPKWTRNMMTHTESGPNIGRLNYHYIEKAIIQVAHVFGLNVEGYE